MFLTLTGGSGTGGTAEAYRFFVPGLLIQLAYLVLVAIGLSSLSYAAPATPGPEGFLPG